MLSKSLSAGSHYAIVRGVTGVKLQLVKTPSVKSGELLLAPLFAGLCGTDIQILRGERNETAAIIGHEGIAEIVQVGEDCPPHLIPGTRVLINPTNPFDSQFLLGHNVDGLFQEYVHVPSSVVAAKLLIPISESFPLALAPLIEPLAVVFYAFQLLQPQQRKGSLIVYGDGIIGHLALLLARNRFGVSLPIIFVHHSQEGLEWSDSRNILGDLNCLFSDFSSCKVDIKNLPAITSALLATPRVDTLSCLSYVVEHIAPHGCIDLLGGMPENAHLPSIPGINLSNVRAANCGGFPALGALTRTISDKNKPLVLFGHRGVSNHHLLQALTELTAHSSLYRKLISHIVDLEHAAKFMNHLFQKGSRHMNDQRVMKLGIRIHNTNERSH